MTHERPTGFLVQISYEQRPLAGQRYDEFVAGGLPAMLAIWVQPGELFRHGVSNAVEHAQTRLFVIGMPPLLVGRFHESAWLESPVANATELVNTVRPVALPGLLSEVVLFRLSLDQETVLSSCKNN